MKQVMIILFGLLFIGNVSNAQRIYYSTEPATGKKDIVSVEIPSGWVQDEAKEKGVSANQVLVKEGDSKGMIFIQTIAADETHKTAEALIVREKLMYDTKTTTVRELLPVTIEKKNAQARIVRVSGSADGEQLAAFIPVKNGVVAITLCSTESDFIEENKTAFETLVKSYRLNPIINPPAFAELVID